jgi:hypothetical protein
MKPGEVSRFKIQVSRVQAAGIDAPLRSKLKLELQRGFRSPGVAPKRWTDRVTFSETIMKHLKRPGMNCQKRNGSANKKPWRNAGERMRIWDEA